MEEPGGLLQVHDEARALQLARLIVGRAEDGRGVDRGQHGRLSGHFQHPAPVFGDAEGRTEEGLRGGGSQADDQAGPNGLHFGVQPGAAGGDFAGAGLLMNAALAARFPLEVLDGVGDISRVTIDAGLLQAAVEETAGGTNKRVAFDVFAVAGLLADQDEGGTGLAFTEDGLGGVLVKRTAAAVPRGVAQAPEVVLGRQEFCRGSLFAGSRFGCHRSLRLRCRDLKSLATGRFSELPQVFIHNAGRIPKDRERKDRERFDSTDAASPEGSLGGVTSRHCYQRRDDMKVFSANLDSLRQLYINQLQMLLSTEEQITEALPKMIDKSTDTQLKQAFQSHLQETEVHVERLQQILNEIAGESSKVKCKTLAAMVTETEDMVKDAADDAVRDAALISAGQRVEHFEIATYGAVRQWAQMLGRTSDAELLDKTIKEEGHADHLLTEIANRVNSYAQKAA